MKSASVLVLAVAVAGSLSSYLAFAGNHPSPKNLDTSMTQTETKAKDLVDIAVSVPDVSTLVAALKAADLVDTLKGAGPFTVFAPTNEAFAKLPAGTVETLLKPENKEQLKKILLFHVHVGAGVKAADVKTMKLSTAAGQDLDIKVEGGGVTVNGAKVIKNDVVGSNGVIHLIDAVLLPK